MGWRYDWKPYVPVATRRAQAAKEAAKRMKKGEKITPVVIEGRTIVNTFWGKAWCENLESYSDFENRLPRGRTYVRNGSVVHLKIEKGRITALVSGSEPYDVTIEIAALPAKAWQAVKKLCAGKIGSLVELLQGKLSSGVMAAVTNRDEGLFPKPKEIKMRCSCPDSAGMCKHLAAVMYGVGSRLDASPELLFQLRAVDHLELIEEAIPAAPTRAKQGAPTIATADLGSIFDIEIEDAPPEESPKSKAAKEPKVKATTAKKAVKAKAASQKPAAQAKKAPKVETAPEKPAAKVKKTAAPAKTKAATVAKRGKAK